jgi:PAS domain S-box-containing protein
MVALITGLGCLCDSLAGYLLIVAITSGFPLISNKLNLPQAKTALKLHPNLPDLLEFNPVECLALYLVSYPVLAAYRAIPSGNIMGYLALSIMLFSILLWGIGPVVINLRKAEQEAKDEISSLGEIMSPKRERTHFRGNSNMSSNMTVDTNSVIDLHDESLNTVTTFQENNQCKGNAEGENLNREYEHKEENKDAFAVYDNDLCHIPLSEEALATFDKPDLCGHCKLKLESNGYRISIVPSSVQRSSVKLTEDEDALSVVTWNPKHEPIKNSLSSEDLIGHRRGSSHQQEKTTPRISHRKCKSQIPIQTVNLIDDSNQEPHYSNLIDSANAPIFGVDSEGRVNVWNKCAMRIVGYTAEEVMGKNLVKEFITKDYQGSVGTVIDRALQGDETANYEFPLMTKDGIRIEILLNATARRNPNGEIIGVVGIGQDITGRIAQEREYTRLIDTANAPIFGVDTQCGEFIMIVPILLLKDSRVISLLHSPSCQYLEPIGDSAGGLQHGRSDGKGTYLTSSCRTIAILSNAKSDSNSLSYYLVLSRTWYKR